MTKPNESGEVKQNPNERGATAAEVSEYAQSLGGAGIHGVGAGEPVDGRKLWAHSQPPKPEDGGPAFPHEDSGSISLRPGMSLRDYFAAKVIQGELASQDGEKEYQSADANWLARWAYEMADAMLKARSQ